MDPDGTHDHDPSLFELEVRQLPGVVWCALEESPRSVSIEVLTADPLSSEATIGRVHRLAERHYDLPVEVQLSTSGAPSLPLEIEAVLARMEGVVNVAALRGSRGELVSLTVSVRDPQVRHSVVAAVEREIGSPLAPERLVITVARASGTTEEARTDRLDAGDRRR